MVEYIDHVKCVVELYKMQIDEGRLFPHEHPAKASAGVARLLRRTYDAEHPAKASAEVARFFQRTMSSVEWAKF